MRNFYPGSKGQTLVETIIALAVATLIVSALVVGATVSIKNARLAKDQSLATKYAQEAIERARSYRDQNGWTEFWDDKIASPTPETDYPGSIFTRTVTYGNSETIPGAADRAKVTVTVQWTEGSREHQSKLDTYLTKWE